MPGFGAPPEPLTGLGRSQTLDSLASSVVATPSHLPPGVLATPPTAHSNLASPEAPTPKSLVKDFSQLALHTPPAAPTKPCEDTYVDTPPDTQPKQSPCLQNALYHGDLALQPSATELNNTAGDNAKKQQGTDKNLSDLPKDEQNSNVESKHAAPANTDAKDSLACPKQDLSLQDSTNKTQAASSHDPCEDKQKPQAEQNKANGQQPADKIEPNKQEAKTNAAPTTHQQSPKSPRAADHKENADDSDDDAGDADKKTMYKDGTYWKKHACTSFVFINVHYLMLAYACFYKL